MTILAVAILRHVRADDAGEHEAALGIVVELALEHIAGQILQMSTDDVVVVVHQHVDAAEFSSDLINQCFRTFTGEYVGRRSCPLRLFASIFPSSSSRAAAQNQVRALACKAECQRLTPVRC